MAQSAGCQPKKYASHPHAAGKEVDRYNQASRGTISSLAEVSSDLFGVVNIVGTIYSLFKHIYKNWQWLIRSHVICLDLRGGGHEWISLWSTGSTEMDKTMNRILLNKFLLFCFWWIGWIPSWLIIWGLIKNLAHASSTHTRVFLKTVCSQKKKIFVHMKKCKNTLFIAVQSMPNQQVAL